MKLHERGLDALLEAPDGRLWIVDTTARGYVGIIEVKLVPDERFKNKVGGYWHPWGKVPMYYESPHWLRIEATWEEFRKDPLVYLTLEVL